MTALTWACLTCKNPVEGHDGYLHINHTQVHHVETTHRAFDQQHKGQVIQVSELLDLPGLAKWEVHHAACDPRPESNDYWISIDRIDTASKLLSWTAHLMEKNWISYTNWSSVIRSQAGVDA